jgi:hypothetical protein
MFAADHAEYAVYFSLDPVASAFGRKETAETR